MLSPFHTRSHTENTFFAFTRNQKMQWLSCVAVDKTIKYYNLQLFSLHFSHKNFVCWTLDATKCLFDWNWTSFIYTFVSNTDLYYSIAPICVVFVFFFKYYFVWMCFNVKLKLGKTHTTTNWSNDSNKKKHILKTRDVMTLNERKNTLLRCYACLDETWFLLWYIDVCVCICMWVFILESQKIEKNKIHFEMKGTNVDSPIYSLNFTRKLHDFNF